MNLQCTLTECHVRANTKQAVFQNWRLHCVADYMWRTVIVEWAHCYILLSWMINLNLIFLKSVIRWMYHFPFPNILLCHVIKKHGYKPYQKLPPSKSLALACHWYDTQGTWTYLLSANLGCKPATWSTVRKLFVGITESFSEIQIQTAGPPW
jgi:hypothetical protein